MARSWKGSLTSPRLRRGEAPILAPLHPCLDRGSAIKAIGGALVGRLWPRDEGERKAALDGGYDLEAQLTQDDLVSGDDCFFSATGVTDGDVLQGVRYEGRGVASTESIVMRSSSGTVRRVMARHNREKLAELIG